MRVGGIVVLGIGLALGSLLTLLICPRGCSRAPLGLRRGGESGFLRGPDTLRRSDTIWVWDTAGLRAHTPVAPPIPADTAIGDTAPPMVWLDTFRDDRIRIYLRDTVAGSRVLGRGIGYALRGAVVETREAITRYQPLPPRLSPYVGAWGMGGIPGASPVLGIEAGLGYGRWRAGGLLGYGGQWVYGVRLTVDL